METFQKYKTLKKRDPEMLAVQGQLVQHCYFTDEEIGPGGVWPSDHRGYGVYQESYCVISQEQCVTIHEFNWAGSLCTQ